MIYILDDDDDDDDDDHDDDNDNLLILDRPIRYHPSHAGVHFQISESQVNEMPASPPSLSFLQADVVK